MTVAITSPARGTFGGVRRHKLRWQARCMVDGRAVTRNWLTEDQAWDWLAWMKDRRYRWPGKALQEMPGYSTATHLAELVGLSRTAVTKNLGRGLTDREADRYALALGYFPWEVWGMEAWLDAADEVFPGDLDRAPAA